MTGLWVVAAIGVAALFAFAAEASDRFVTARGGAKRWVWMASIALASITPFALSVRSDWVALGETRNSGEPVSHLDSTAASAGSHWRLDAQRRFERVSDEYLEKAIVWTWPVLSLLLLARLVWSLRLSHRVVQSAAQEELCGQPVLISESFGPAAVGVLRPRIVIPRSLLCLDDSLSALIVRHEQEHCRARDAVLLFAAELSIVLMPWNVGLWWMRRRLRLAIELDCDARTVRSGCRPQIYLKLMLLVAQAKFLKGPTNSRPFALLAPQYELSARIAALQRRHSSASARASKLRLVVYSSLALASSGSAASVPFPSMLQRAASPATTLEGSKVGQKLPSPAINSSAASWEVPAADRPASLIAGPETIVYPALLKKARVEGVVLVEYVVELDGTVASQSFHVIESPRLEFSEAVREALDRFRYRPALKSGNAVRERVRLRFAFAVPREK